MYFDEYNFHILFYKQSFMELNKIKCSLQIKENFFEDSIDYITYFIKIEGEIQNIKEFNESDLLFQPVIKSIKEFKINDLNKYKRFVINIRFHHNSSFSINKNIEPVINETEDKKLIEIMYKLIESNFVSSEIFDLEEDYSN